MLLLSYDPASLLTSIISLLVHGITDIASGIGSGLNDLAMNVFIDSTTGGLSVFGSLIVIFAGVALAIGMSKFIVNFLTSWGK